MVLLRQIVATLDRFFPATAPVLVALQLNEVKTSFDVFKQWLYHFWCSRLGDFKYNSLANCAVGNWVLTNFSVSVFIESYLFAAKECKLYISLLFHFLNYWALSVCFVPSFLQFSLYQWTPKKSPKTPKIPPKLSTNIWMSSCQRFKWVKIMSSTHNELQKAMWKHYLISIGVLKKYE